MKVSRPILLGLSLALAGCTLAAAQEMSDMSAPPKVLLVQREFLKPGKSGAPHDRSESNFVQAFARAKWPTHYIALNSLSGKSRALFLTGYPSFEAMQKDYDAADKDPVLGPELDRLAQADGELLDSTDEFLLTYDADSSYRANPDLSHVRYLEVSTYKLHPGHHAEWSEIVKLVIAAHQKAGDDSHWATYELAYGGADEYVIFSSDQSMADIDKGFAQEKDFMAAMGDDGMKKLDELAASCLESGDSNLFAINPRQSYAPEDWIKADPGFWKPKPMGAPAAMTAAPAKKTNP
jgi:hypothetical protein